MLGKNPFLVDIPGDTPYNRLMGAMLFSPMAIPDPRRPADLDPHGPLLEDQLSFGAGDDSIETETG